MGFFARTQATCVCLLLTLLAARAVGATDQDALSRGRELLERGRLLSAEKVLQEAVSVAPESAEAHLLLGRVLDAQGDSDAARAELERAAALGAAGPELDTALGIAYYETDEIESALKHLRRALEAQPDAARIRLYLGQAELAAGHPEAAATEFQALVDHPEYGQTALYNLGMVRLGAGEADAARALLEEAALRDPESRTGRRAAALAVEISEELRRWSLSGNLGFLYDDNVTTSEADLSTGLGDGAFAVDVSGSYRLLDSPALGLEAGYDFFQTAYFQLGDFNQQIHSLSLDASREFREVEAGLGYRFSLSTLGGDLFLDIHEIRPSIGYSVTPWWYSVLTPRVQVKTFHEESSRDAVQGAVGIDNFLFLNGSRSYGVLGVRTETEDARGDEFDYLGFAMQAGVRHPFSIAEAGYRFEFDYAFRLRDYQNITPSIGTERDDRTHTARLRLARNLTRHTEVRLDYEYTDSDSNLPSIDYRQNVVGMSFALDL
jgi:tetratricopeptide (TPR) repeat protein